jgi:CYTH domain-containing protein
MSAPKYTRPENERRFLVDRDFAASLEARRGWLIEDRYLSCGLLRLRRITDEASGARTFKLAKKFPSDATYTRPLVCIYLDEAEHAALSALDGTELRKRRIHVDEQGWQFGVDFFAGPLAGLVLCEVETATLDELLALRPPSWAPLEVTADPFFSGGALCRTDAGALADRLRRLLAPGAA